MLTSDVQLYAQCTLELFGVLSPSMKAMTNARWQYAIENQGRHAIWFDPETNNKPRSIEFCTSETIASSREIPQLKLQCELGPLLDLLQRQYEDTDAILGIDDYHTKLVDVGLDVGRIPHVYTGKKQRVVLNKDLGHPGSGKTTLIRDVARCVSETMENVCIIVGTGGKSVGR
ncbi:hypothetical protein PHMEG_00030408 [Phytophthora megakarya]|uniref:Uncharacterized protein n=1 Tax=Phytophthora megakarya TaxID=4795 RepID=A0A225V0E5_9STRA|nr:hypothetical protein PHMEG_00030408 [Phytophthora megakarya]